MFVLDVSGSMSDPAQAGDVPKIQAAQTSAGNLISFIQQENTASSPQLAGLVAFNDSIVENDAPSTSFDALNQKLKALSPGGQTDIYDALNTAIDASGNGPPDAKRIVILLTDGLQNSPDKSTQDFLDGPVQKARGAGVTLCTIGLGQAGEFDEDLLRQMASPDCPYQPAGQEFQLQQVYLKVHASSLGTIAQEFHGDIAQGETANVGNFTVASGVGQLNVADTWPGSTLRLRLTDPSGQPVGTGYPGANLGSTGTAENVLIDSPQAGQWGVQLFGEQVSQPREPYYVVVSTRAAPPAPPPVKPPPPPNTTVTQTANLSGDDATPVALTLTFAGLALVAVIGAFALRGRRRGGPAAVLYGPGGMRVPLAEGAYLLGRDPVCDIVLQDPDASRRHARLRIERGGATVEDLGSTHGVFVNGARMLSASLRPGDRLRLGRSELMFESMDPSTAR